MIEVFKKFLEEHGAKSAYVMELKKESDFLAYYVSKHGSIPEVPIPDEVVFEFIESKNDPDSYLDNAFYWDGTFEGEVYWCYLDALWAEIYNEQVMQDQ